MNPVARPTCDLVAKATSLTELDSDPQAPNIGMAPPFIRSELLAADRASPVPFIKLDLSGISGSIQTTKAQGDAPTKFQSEHAACSSLSSSELTDIQSGDDLDVVRDAIKELKMPPVRADAEVEGSKLAKEYPQSSEDSGKETPRHSPDATSSR